MNDDDRKYWGKYRATVSKNDDPQRRGRIQVKVPDVLGDEDSTWALPCAPYGGKDVGLFLVPPEDALVWVEFEQGDLDYPIWSGCFWAENEVPGNPATPDMKVLKTGAATLTINDEQGEESITIETSGGLKIVMDSDGISLSNGSQKIVLGSDSVSINDGALEVQ